MKLNWRTFRSPQINDICRALSPAMAGSAIIFLNRTSLDFLFRLCRQQKIISGDHAFACFIFKVKARSFCDSSAFGDGMD